MTPTVYEQTRVYNRIELFRTEKGLSRKELAAKVGVNYRTLGAVEREEYKISVKLAFAICECLEVPFELAFSSRPLATLAECIRAEHREVNGAAEECEGRARERMAQQGRQPEGQPERSAMFGLNKRTPETLTLEELLGGTDVGEYGSWYEHEIFRKVSTRWRRTEDKGRFIEEEARALSGYDAAATDAVYRSRGIQNAFVLDLPAEARFGCPAVALYLRPDAPEGFPERWAIVRFYGYKVVPRFYEPIGIHELVGWNLAERFPEAEEGDTAREGAGDPDLDPLTGVVRFRVHPDGAGRAARFARRLKEAMGELGVVCDPAVALSGARDYDPLAIEDTHGGVPERDEHPYYRPNGYPGRPAPFPRGLDCDAPRSHRVVPTAGPLVPDQGRADRLLWRLKEHAPGRVWSRIWSAGWRRTGSPRPGRPPSRNSATRPRVRPGKRSRPCSRSRRPWRDS